MASHRPLLPPLPCRRLTGVRILGTGSYVPDTVVTNDDLKERLGCDPAWIVKRTGVVERRHASPHEATSDLCAQAAQRCLNDAGVTANDVDLIVVATFSADMSFPSTACLVQDRLRANCPALDLHAGCSGFVYALVTAAAYVRSGASKLALVIGGDCSTRMLNPADPKTFPIFGDGAGAVLLAGGEPNQGLLSYVLGSDGGRGDLLTRPACGSRMPLTPEGLEKGLHYVHMDGPAVFRWAVGIFCESTDAVLNAADLTPDNIDYFFPHQANIRIISAAIENMRIPWHKVRNNLERFGNTSAASIPLALDEARAEGIIKTGQKLLFSGFGAGLSWGTAVFAW